MYGSKKKRISPPKPLHGSIHEMDQKFVDLGVLGIFCGGIHTHTLHQTLLKTNQRKNEQEKGNKMAKRINKRATEMEPSKCMERRKKFPPKTTARVYS
ncbi:hypothetical protein CEXT_116081 [Caerostris extrusa]|uniref:Uncharacterized protein n=1 Tax=Caerostris extrusa TaxID=172846 RepID=A0AAV4N1S6_CAEEX|nr:hypothetical protein CEXT_116081 [Caerostris extrusa]